MSQLNMNKSNLSSRVMSVNNWHYDKNNKTQPKTNASSYKQTLVEHQSNRMQLTEIYDIFYVHFPHMLSNITKKNINENNFLQILNNLLNVIKNANQSQVKQLKMEYQNIELQLKVVRDARNSAMEKIKSLQNELFNINQKIKSKELDCFTKNQQIFQNKQKIESIQKQIVLKNLQVKQIYTEWKSYKHEADEAIQNLQNINLKLNKDNKKLKKQIINLEQRLNDLQIQIEKSTSRAKKNSKNSSVLYHQSELQENVANSANLNIRNRSNSATVSQYSHKMKKQQKLAMLSSQQLKAEVNELRQNQSALLDRLAERDKIIQKLQNSLSNSRVYE